MIADYSPGANLAMVTFMDKLEVSVRFLLHCKSAWDEDRTRAADAPVRDVDKVTRWRSLGDHYPDRLKHWKELLASEINRGEDG
jgi:hypothetical protein